MYIFLDFSGLCIPNRQAGGPLPGRQLGRLIGGGNWDFRTFHKLH